MSEQLANLYSTTLAAPYVAGSGAITVTSATGAPTTGTFSLTILDASTGDVILIFRVTSVASLVFSGASEGPDSSAASGSIVVGTMLTVAAITQLFADHTSPGFIQPLTAPISGDFTPLNFNTGSGVVTTQSNNSSPVVSISLMQTDPNTTNEIAALAKNKLASTFTVTIGMTMAAIPEVSGNSEIEALAGLWISDGGSPPNNIIFCLQSGAYSAGVGWRAPLFSNLSGSFTSDVFPQDAPWTQNAIFGPLIWLRIQETASARNYYLSADGVLWALLYTESNTAHFTTAQYGFACEVRTQPGSIGMAVYSFTETNP